MKSYVCQFKDHLTRRKSSRPSLSLDRLHRFCQYWMQGLPITNRSRVWTSLVFSVSLLPDTYCLLPLDVGELGMSWKTLQKPCRVLQLSLPFHREHLNWENYTDWLKNVRPFHTYNHKTKPFDWKQTGCKAFVTPQLSTSQLKKTRKTREWFNLFCRKMNSIEMRIHQPFLKSSWLSRYCVRWMATDWRSPGPFWSRFSKATSGFTLSGCFLKTSCFEHQACKKVTCHLWTSLLYLRS